MSDNTRNIDLTDEQLKKIAGGGSSADESFSFTCLLCGTEFTVGNAIMGARCPNCGEEYNFTVTEQW